MITPCTIGHLHWMLNAEEGANSDLLQDLKQTEHRLIIAVDTEAHEYLDLLEAKVAKAPDIPKDKIQLLRFSDALTDLCKSKDIHDICIQRTPGTTTIDFNLARRLATKDITAHFLPDQTIEELTCLRDIALQHQRDKHPDTAIFDEFWNAWYVTLAPYDAKLILLDNYNFPGISTRPPYMDLAVVSTRGLYAEAIIQWSKQRIATH